MKVIKRNKELEDFSKEKIKRVVIAAGLDEPEANKIANETYNWFSIQDTQEISTLDIRDKVLELLKERDEYAAGLYEWYEKTKDK